MQTSHSPDIFVPLLKAYSEQSIPLYYERHNSGSGRSQSLGILPRRNYGVGESRNNDRFKTVLEEARKLAKVICPDLNYTTIMMNHNYEALPHRDKNNDGISCVVAFGDYTGGELKIDDTLYNLQYRPFFFNASTTTHSVEPITSGTRFSIVFFRPRFPKSFTDVYGSTLTYDEIQKLIPARLPGQPASAVKVPVKNLNNI
jgi:hypothetical protein